MNSNIFVMAGVIALFIGIVSLMVLLVVRQRRKPLNVEKYTIRWKEAQKKCAKKETWPLAIIDTDKLLDDVLKAKHYKGKSTGERLMTAQHDLTDNDWVWCAHKLRNQLVHEDGVQLTQNKVREALMGYRQALRDLGAIEK